VLMGYLVGNRLPVRLFEYHDSTWVWPEDRDNYPRMQVNGLPLQNVWPAKEVILRVSVTFRVRPEQTNTVGLGDVIEIDLELPMPEWGIVRSERQVKDYARVFRDMLDKIAGSLPTGQRIHLFYAGPNSLGFCLGQQISENIHPPVIVWNYHQGYDWAIDLHRIYEEDLASCIVRP
jgi:hypothetical protein